MNQPIKVETFQVDSMGNPIIGEVTSISAAGGSRILQNSNALVKEYRVRSAHIGKTMTTYEGTKLFISVGDSPSGQSCPTKVILGEIVLGKGKIYELTNDPKLPIDESWTVFNPGSIRGIGEEMVPIYPRHMKNQAQLMNLILSHESISTSPFVRIRFEHPPEIQDQLDLDDLLNREKSLLERQKKMEEEFKLQELKLESERKKLKSKISKSQKELVDKEIELEKIKSENQKVK